MTGPKCQLDLADMADLPMSAGWYWELGYLRDVLRHLASKHASAIAGRRFAPVDQEWHETVQRHAAAAIEHVDRVRRTMEAAGVLGSDG